MGRLRRQVRKVWPSFRVDVEPSLRLRGVPEGGKLARKYIVATWQRNWKRRQERIFQARPTANQQDYLLYKILLEMTSDRVDGSLICTTEAILPDVNSISHVALQTMLRFLGGMTDFARVNAHKPRWSSLPGLRESDQQPCFFCSAAPQFYFSALGGHNSQLTTHNSQLKLLTINTYFFPFITQYITDLSD